MSKPQNTLVGGVAVLGVAGIISKVIGMFFRIPLTNLIGSGGIGLYQKVYPTYTLLLTISTAGIPVAISRLVSENISLGREDNARATLKTALLLLAAIGCVMTVLMIAFNKALAARVGDAEAAAGFIAIAPAVLLVTVMSALRGYTQGHRDMRPTAVSQLIEQIAKVGISLPLAIAGAKRGVAYAAAGALLGITAGEGLAMLFMVLVCGRGRDRYHLRAGKSIQECDGISLRIRNILGIAIPITVGSCIVPLASFIDSVMITQRLETAGIEAGTARSLYGLLSGSVLSIVNVPTVLAAAVCMGLVPMISAARVEKDRQKLAETSELGLKIGSLIGFPCAIGMSMLATSIIRLLYPALPQDEILTAGRILTVSALSILVFTQVQATTGILQGTGHQNIPMISLAIGVVCKIALNYFLLSVPAINIIGAPIASIVCYGVSLGINLLYIVVKIGVPLNVRSLLLKPAAATAAMAAVVYAVNTWVPMPGRLKTVFAVAAGGLVYFLAALALGLIREEEVSALPGFRQIGKVLRRLHLWK